MAGFAASGDAPTQGFLDQPSEFQDIFFDSEYDYYSKGSDSEPPINFNGGDGDQMMAFTEPSIKNEAVFDEISSDGRFWPGYTRIPGLTMLEQDPPFPISDLSQSHNASSSSSSLYHSADSVSDAPTPPINYASSSLYQSADSVFEAPTPPINYTALNTDTMAYHSPTSDGFPITLTRAPFPTVVPLLPTSPVRRKRESSSSSCTSTVDGGRRITKPKQRLIKHHPNGGKAPTTPNQQALRSLIDAPGTGVYNGHIASAEAAVADDAELRRMFRRAAKLCTNLSSDATFPAHDTDKRKYVCDMYNAIWDWSDYVEMDKTLGSASMGASQQADMPSRAEQQKKVLSSPLNDYVVEQLCWRLLKSAQDAQQGIPTVDHWSRADGAWESYATFGDRVAAVSDSLRSSKQLVKSLLTAGDRWCARIANNPKGEHTHKVNNMKVNRRKNERLREATSARKKKEEEEEEEEE
ncbi:hypothetical protein BBO_00202 [Beauveria brongniartii RCEF 3172]|uniref:Uncharacterized protein n=1 Tax=Beauveria brongniartii RCEF 3172 TaxID=1081107 RepID=A0A167KY33_9HYPO|nr:hypothetical protein BBO_00202 [Beauveria brongniartii RCEF 3172]